jgi:hypothetical protein
VASKPLKATFDEAAMKTAADLHVPNFTIEGVTTFGRLRELRDRADALDENEDRAFFGELVRDDGSVWRIEFKPADVAEATRLFRRQVWITGSVTYYKAQAPKITAEDFGSDDERDYEAAFDELSIVKDSGSLDRYNAVYSRHSALTTGDLTLSQSYGTCRGLLP